MSDRHAVDVAVVGAGPAGLSAAVHAAESGARVTVIDQTWHAGGQIWRHRDRAELPDEARALMARFEASGAQHLAGTSLFDARPGHLSVLGPNGSLELIAGAVVLATGARERFLPFPGWTLPNVFGVGGLQALVKAGLEVNGKRIALSGSGPLLFPVAATLAQHGAQLAAVCEQAPRGRVTRFAASLWREPGKLAQAARYRSTFRHVPFRMGTWIERAEGEGRVQRAILTDGTRRWSVDCDMVGAACGLIPSVEVGMAMGCDIVNGAVAVDARQQTSVAGVYAAGECTGVAGEDAAIVEGAIAGLSAAGRPAEALYARRDRGRAFAARLETAFSPRPELRDRADATTIVCRCEDVRLDELRAEWGARQGKLASRAGMGACQGRVCGAALAHLFGWEAPRVRPPLVPVPVSALRPAEPLRD